MKVQGRGASNGRVGGLVLAAGRSSRFGADKAMARLGGRPLLAWSLAALDAECEAVAVSASPRGRVTDKAKALDRVVLVDDPAHPRGPLAGVAAGLKWARAQGFGRLATLPCDTPLVGGAEVAALIASAGDAPAAYAVTSDGPQPLCAVWRVDLGEALAARLAGGDHPPIRAFLAEVGALAVAFDDPVTFYNTNSP